MRSYVDFPSILLILVIAMVSLMLRNCTGKKGAIIRLVVILLSLACLAALLFLYLSPIQANGDEIVFITDTGSKYHAEGCRHLHSCVPIRLDDAVAEGYGDCAHCLTPKYVPETYYPTIADLLPPEGIEFAGLFLLSLAMLFAIFFVAYWLTLRHRSDK